MPALIAGEGCKRETMMRSMLLAFAMLSSAIIASPAWSQWSPPGPYTFVQGQTYDLEFVQPALDDFLSLDLSIRYPTAVFEPIALLPGSLASMLSVLPSAPIPIGGGIDQVLITISPSNSPPPGMFGLNLPAGSMFGARFKVKSDAPLGTATPSSDFTFIFGDHAHVDITAANEVSGSVAIASNIAAVPEPQTWAMMLAGIAMVGALAARKRKDSAAQ